MKQFSDYLTEHILSIGLNKKHDGLREKHRSEIHDMISKSYSVLPDGYGGLGTGTEEESKAIHNDISNSMIKATRRDGKLTSVNLYKKHHGRKSIALATDGTRQGKDDILKIKREDHENKRSYGEFSGPADHLQDKIGTPKIPNTDVEKIIGKKITPDDDGHYYTRDIGGTPHKKVLRGHPKLNQ